MRRDLRLDAIRGILLAEIAFVHTRVPGSSFVYEFFGRVSTAAGFVFLSGLVAGAVYGSIADRSLSSCSSAAFQRAVYIHKYHVATFIFLVLIALLVPRYVSYFDFDWLGNPSEAWRHGLKFLVLAYQPTFFDILPLYTLFVLAMPLAFLGFKRGHSTTVMVVSLLIWGIAQFGVVDARTFGGSYFNPLAWQLLYFSGLYFGYHQLHRRQQIVRPDHRLIAACLLIVAFGFSLRWNPDAWPDLYHSGTFLSNKMNHSALYLFNFFAFVYLLFCLLQRFPRLITVGPFVYLGKHSIQVFSFHIAAIYLTLPLLRKVRHMAPELEDLLGLLIVLTLFLPAIVHSWYRRNSGMLRQPHTQSGRGGFLSFRWL